MGIHPITLEVEAEDQNLRPPWTIYREGNWLKTAIHIFLHLHTYVGQRTYVNSSQKKKIPTLQMVDKHMKRQSTSPIIRETEMDLKLDTASYP